jgi:hypothetical protein
MALPVLFCFESDRVFFYSCSGDPLLETINRINYIIDTSGLTSYICVYYLSVCTIQYAGTSADHHGFIVSESSIFGSSSPYQ